MKIFNAACKTHLNNQPLTASKLPTSPVSSVQLQEEEEEDFA